MSMIEILKPDFEFDDERGKICQLISRQLSQVNYLFTRKAARRGSHYHKENSELFYVIKGKVKLTACSSANVDEKNEYVFETGDMFLVKPFVIHDFDFMEDTQMIVSYDKGVESNGIKDIYTK